KDRYSNVQADAAWALGQIGPEAKRAVPALIDRLNKSDEPEVRWNAAWALGKIGAEPKSAVPKSAVPALIEVLNKESEPEVLKRAAWALGQIGEEETTTIPTLIPRLKNQQARGAAAQALVNIADALLREGRTGTLGQLEQAEAELKEASTDRQVKECYEGVK